MQHVNRAEGRQVARDAAPRWAETFLYGIVKGNEVVGRDDGSRQLFEFNSCVASRLHERAPVLIGLVEEESKDVQKFGTIRS